MFFDADQLALLAEAQRVLDQGFASLPEFRSSLDLPALRAVLLATAERLRDNCPYPHPLYIGQMLKPPHPIARLAYTLALAINPNNHALDGGRASSLMEKETVAALARLFGWESHLGHLCSGGTFANFEALWIARELHPGKQVLASSLAHYTHERLSAVLQIPFQKVPVDELGRMDVTALEALLASGDVGTVVVTLGTTAAGTIDPLPAILALRKRHEFRIHVDAAYGGYFTLASNLSPATHAAFDALSAVDSLVVDPHKHGLQPYGCGCILFRDPAVGRFYRHDSPYTYFSSDELHLGEISLECSRPGASAVALWATLQLLPLVPDGVFARDLTSCRATALALHDWLQGDGRFAPPFLPELDIVVWAVKARTATEASARARRLFAEAAKRDLHLALATFPRGLLEASAPVEDWDADSIVCLRACAMKPEQRDWLPEITRRLDAAAS
jgi:glutamate/tyrosine decarboxylase-like PLP-dependent enzyme